MARTRTPAPPTDDPAETAASPEEAERLHEDRDSAADPEVRPEDFKRIVAQPARESAFPDPVVQELRKPLDPNRVRKRDNFEYLAGHDVYRRANEIFGFGMWGTRIVDLAELDAVQVAHRTDANKQGWTVGYRCVVELWVEGMRGPISGVGFGNGVEYTPAARVNAQELAMKEAETDATKRAFTKLGDQFGLILYAKDDEKRRIESNRDREDAVAATREPMPDFPESWAAIQERMSNVLGAPEAEEWIKQAVAVLLGGKPSTAATAAERQSAFQRMSALTTDLEAIPADLMLTLHARAVVQEAFAKRLDGMLIEGPPWALDPEEVKAGRPVAAHDDALRARLAGDSDPTPEADPPEAVSS